MGTIIINLLRRRIVILLLCLFCGLIHFIFTGALTEIRAITEEKAEALRS